MVEALFFSKIVPKISIVLWVLCVPLLAIWQKEILARRVLATQQGHRLHPLCASLVSILDMDSAMIARQASCAKTTQV